MHKQLYNSAAMYWELQKTYYLFFLNSTFCTQFYGNPFNDCRDISDTTANEKLMKSMEEMSAESGWSILWDHKCLFRTLEKIMQ